MGLAIARYIVDKESVNWDASFPQFRFKRYPIISPRPHQRIVCIVTSTTWEGVYTHFYNRRTHPCIRETGRCEGCETRQAKRWKAYLAGVLLPAGRECLIELTVGALDSCPTIRNDNGRLRGLWVELTRRGDSRNGAVKALVLNKPAPADLPDAFNVREALCVIWGVQHDKASPLEEDWGSIPR